MRTRRASENASKKTIMTRRRVRKYRMGMSLLKERQNSIRDRLQENLNISSNETTISISQEKGKKFASG